MLGRSDVRYTEATWAEDRATRGRDPSADPGAKTGVGGRTPPLGIPGIGRNALNPLTSCVISECGSDSACPVHAEPVRPQAPRASRLRGCSTDMRHAYIFKVVQRAPFLLASHAVRHMSGFPGALDRGRTGPVSETGPSPPNDPAPPSHGRIRREETKSRLGTHSRVARVGPTTPTQSCGNNRRDS